MVYLYFLLGGYLIGLATIPIVKSIFRKRTPKQTELDSHIARAKRTIQDSIHGSTRSRNEISDRETRARKIAEDSARIDRQISERSGAGKRESKKSN